MKFEEKEKNFTQTEESQKEEVDDLIYSLIICSDSQWKPIFDLFMLLIVCYSCIFNVIVVTFQTDSFDNFDVPNRCIESFFYLDLVLNFF